MALFARGSVMHIILKTLPVAAVLALAGCNQAPPDTSGDQTLAEAGTLPPLAAGPPELAPDAGDLPAAQPLGYDYAPASPQAYAPIARAASLLDTIGEAPPDYAFDYGGVEPWAWQTADDYYVYAEPIDDGYRYYYYGPDAAEPFLVRDPYYSYGYDDGRVIAVYDARGRYLDRIEARRRAQTASRYYQRARQLRHAARAENRRAIAASRWAVQRRHVAAARRDWDRARTQQAAWQSWRDRRRDDELREHRQAERRARAAPAVRFARWQQADFRGPAPRLYEATARTGAAHALARREALAREAQVRRQQASVERRRAEARRQQATTARARQQQAERRHEASETRARAGQAQRRQAAAEVRRRAAETRQQAQTRAQAQARRHAAQQNRQRAAQARQHDQARQARRDAAERQRTEQRRQAQQHRQAQARQNASRQRHQAAARAQQQQRAAASRTRHQSSLRQARQHAARTHERATQSGHRAAAQARAHQARPQAATRRPAAERRQAQPSAHHARPQARHGAAANRQQPKRRPQRQ
jgi:hypothetical protein